MKQFWKKFALVALIFTGVFVLLFGKTIYYSFEEPVEVCNTDTGFDYKARQSGGHITAEVTTCVGEAGSIVTTTKRRGSTTKSTKYYYIIPVMMNKELYFVCTEVSENKRADFEALMDGTKNRIVITGTFSDLDDEIYDYFKECMDEGKPHLVKSESNPSGPFKDDEDFDKHVLDLCLEPLDFEHRNIYIGLIVGGAAITIFAFIMFLRSKKKLAQQIADYDAKRNAELDMQNNMQDTFSNESSEMNLEETTSVRTTLDDQNM